MLKSAITETSAVIVCRPVTYTEGQVAPGGQFSSPAACENSVILNNCTITANAKPGGCFCTSGSQCASGSCVDGPGGDKECSGSTGGPLGVACAPVGSCDFTFYSDLTSCPTGMTPTRPDSCDDVNLTLKCYTSGTKDIGGGKIGCFSTTVTGNTCPADFPFPSCTPVQPEPSTIVDNCPGSSACSAPGETRCADGKRQACNGSCWMNTNEACANTTKTCWSGTPPCKSETILSSESCDADMPYLNKPASCDNLCPGSTECNSAGMTRCVDNLQQACDGTCWRKSTTSCAVAEIYLTKTCWSEKDCTSVTINSSNSCPSSHVYLSIPASCNIKKYYVIR